MSVHRSLIGELEQAIQTGSKDQRLETLRRVTDLFLIEQERLNDDQVAVFDDVLGHLIKRIESKALVQLSECLAPLDNAPVGIVRRLAHDDEIAVAGPVLAQSKRLSTDDLIDIAKTKSQAHLLAISDRKFLEPPLTDALLERGDENVARKLAGSDGARFSEKGFGRLIDHAEGDDDIAERLGMRADMPQHLFRKLLLQATDAVRERLVSRAKPELREHIRGIVDEISRNVEEAAESSYDLREADRLVAAMKENNTLNEGALLDFVQAGQHAETVAALALMASVPAELVARIYQEGRTEALLIPCKAAGISWMTLRAIFRIRSSRFRASEQDLNKAKNEYLTLTKTTAQRVLRFWSAQQSAQFELGRELAPQ